MKLHRNPAILLACALFFGLCAVANADDPDKSAKDPPRPTSTPSPRKGSFDPVPIQSGEAFLDPATASVTRLELAEDDKSLVPATRAAEAIPPAKGSFAPGPMRLRYFDGETFHTIPDSANTTSQGISTAGSVSIISEDFEGAFPGAWIVVDNDGTLNGEYLWGDVPCFAKGGDWSAWPADGGANGFNLTTSDCETATYPDNVDAWLVYGPVSLADAQSAYLDFYYRMVSESCDPITLCDYLFWGASVNGTDFFGERAAGTYANGPFDNNDYNFVSFDLTNVPVLGDLTGEPEVWIAFRFKSNGNTITAQGPFIDDITFRKNTDARIYLTDENFDVEVFPNASWESQDFSGLGRGRWDDVACFSRSGFWAMWPAATDWPFTGLDPCSPSLDEYPNDVYSWLIHGPFSLAGASEAWIDFYFRNASEEYFDFLFWGVSTEGSSFYGRDISGTYTGGPYGNGYNLMRLNLSDVPIIGDLKGESSVWLAFVFSSDSSFTDKGPFIDDVSVVVERTTVTEVFLPIVLKSPESTIPKTNLFINNQTGGVITNYKVINPKLNGAPIPDIICANIPAGATRFDCHATFDTDTYQVSSTNTCNPPTTTGQVTFNPGDDVRLIRCLSNP